MCTHLPPFLRSIGAPFHGYLTVAEDFEHIEPGALNRRAACRAWPLTKLYVPVKIIGGPHAMALFEATSSYTKRNRRRTKVTPWNGAGILPHRMTRTNRSTVLILAPFRRLFNNYSSSPNGLWVNSPWSRRPNWLLIQRPWGRKE